MLAVASQSVPAERPGRRSGAPDIASDLAKAAAACRTACELVDPLPGFGLVDAVDGVVGSISDGQRAARRPLVEVVVDALVGATRRHLDVLAGGPGTTSVPAQAKVASLLATGGLARAATRSFAGAAFAGRLDDLIAAETLGGLDAERLCWSVINRETHRHINLLWQQANKLAGNFPDRSAEDLVGWGWQGLRVALRQFDPDRGFAFSTYACTRIVGYMRDGIRSENPVPKRLTTFAHKVAHAEDTLTQQLGRAPDIEAVAAHLGQAPSDLRILTRLSPAASIDEMADVHRGRTLLVEDHDPADAAVAAALRGAIDEALARLPAPEADAVRMLVLGGLDPSEARRRTGATARQLRQRKERGLALLRQELAAWEPAGVR